MLLFFVPLVEEALREDLAAAGDITTNAIVPPERQAIAHLVARHPNHLAGLFMAERVFARLDPDLVFGRQARRRETASPSAPCTFSYHVG